MERYRPRGTLGVQFRYYVWNSVYGMWELERATNHTREMIGCDLVRAHEWVKADPVHRRVRFVRHSF